MLSMRNTLLQDHTIFYLVETIFFHIRRCSIGKHNEISGSMTLTGAIIEFANETRDDTTPSTQRNCQKKKPVIADRLYQGKNTQSRDCGKRSHFENGEHNRYVCARTGKRNEWKKLDARIKPQRAMSLTIQRGENVLPAYLVAPAVPNIAPPPSIRTRIEEDNSMCNKLLFDELSYFSRAVVDHDWLWLAS